MRIGWLTCIPAVLLPHSLCRFTTANTPANRQMPIASVVMCKCKKRKRELYFDTNSKIKGSNYEINFVENIHFSVIRTDNFV